MGLGSCDHCKQVIADAGLPVPCKSACFCCPASKAWELTYLRQHCPEQWEICKQMEQQYRDGRHYRGRDGVQGLGCDHCWTITEPVVPIYACDPLFPIEV